MITWKIANLNVKEKKTVSFQVKVPAVKEYTRWTNVASTYDDEEPEPKKTPPVEVETFAPSLKIEKSQKRNEGNRTKDKLSVDEKISSPTSSKSQAQDRPMPTMWSSLIRYRAD